jgi:hypothetical protein
MPKVLVVNCQATLHTTEQELQHYQIVSHTRKYDAHCGSLRSYVYKGKVVSVLKHQVIKT